MWRFVTIACVACRVADIDYAGKACPCPSGYVCDPVLHTCQLPIQRDAATSDVPGDADPYRELEFWFALDQSSDHDVPPMPPTIAHGYAANLSDATWQPTGGKLGGALHLDGTSGQAFVRFPVDASGACTAPPAISGSFTASTWVLFERFQDWGGYTLGDVAIMHGTSGGSGGGWGIGATNACGATTAAIEITGSDDTSRAMRCGTQALAIDTFYFITGVYDATVPSLSIYVDGVLDDGAMSPNSIMIPTAIGTPAQCPYLAASGQQGHMLQGSLDEVRIYTRALTATEVMALYRASGG